jgi:GNAT superfamily N-acetyltransferase
VSGPPYLLPWVRVLFLIRSITSMTWGASGSDRVVMGGAKIQSVGELTVTVMDVRDPLAEAVVSGGLASYNEMQSGTRDSRPLNVFVLDTDTEAVLGGLTGRTSLGLLFVDFFFLPDGLRGSGIGSRVLRLAEEEARRRGCVAAVLYTISFQAPGFYERHGYERFGEIPCTPSGTSRIFFTKRFHTVASEPDVTLG